MYDKERLAKEISDIERYKRELLELKINSRKDLEESQKYHAMSMLYFAIMNRIIDLGQEIIITEKLGMPGRYSEIFDKLAKAGIMNKKEAEEIKDFIKYRNIIAHTYFDLDEKDMWKILTKINLVDNFIEKIKKRIKKNG